MESLNPGYKLPSREVLAGRILNEVYGNAIAEAFDAMKALNDVTITLDGWEDVSGNSVYGFMALHNENEHILDIADLSKDRPTAAVLVDNLEKTIKESGLAIESVIALVTDSLQLW